MHGTQSYSFLLLYIIVTDEIVQFRWKLKHKKVNITSQSVHVNLNKLHILYIFNLIVHRDKDVGVHTVTWRSLSSVCVCVCDLAYLHLEGQIEIADRGCI